MPCAAFLALLSEAFPPLALAPPARPRQHEDTVAMFPPRSGGYGSWTGIRGDRYKVIERLPVIALCSLQGKKMRWRRNGAVGKMTFSPFNPRSDFLAVFSVDPTLLLDPILACEMSPGFL